MQARKMSDQVFIPRPRAQLETQLSAPADCDATGDAPLDLMTVQNAMAYRRQILGPDHSVSNRRERQALQAAKTGRLALRAAVGLGCVAAGLVGYVSYVTSSTAEIGIFGPHTWAIAGVGAAIYGAGVAGHMCGQHRALAKQLLGQAQMRRHVEEDTYLAARLAE